MGQMVKMTISDSRRLRAEVDDRFFRRDYSDTKSFDITLAAGVKQDILPAVTTELAMVYIKVKTGGPVQIYKDFSPEYWTFSDTWMAWDLTNAIRVALKSAVASTVSVYIAIE